MIRVEPDGPSNPDIAAVGEAPGRVELLEGRGFVGPSGKILWGTGTDSNLIGFILDLPRSECWVSNVCKIEMPDAEWAKLTSAEQEVFYKEIREELERVGLKVVLAFGRRACLALYPDFFSIKRQHGQPKWGFEEKYIVMPLWHPAASLRGNSGVIPDIATDLSAVPGLLEKGLDRPLKEGPPLPWTTTDEALEAWPEQISFMTLKKRSQLKCTLCGKKAECGSYEGEGLKWKLCLGCAILTCEWATTNEEALKQNASGARQDAQIKRNERAAIRMEERMRKKWIDR